MYVGRFAPSPTGPLHFGSLIAALFGFLRARQLGGRWLLRIEDLDPPRQPEGAVGQILETLQAYGLDWDGPVTYQSRRTSLYDDAMRILAASKLIYPCTCSRSNILDAGAREFDPELGPVYPGTCRSGPGFPDQPAARRIRAPDLEISFSDGLQGRRTQNLAQQSGDFIIRRKDGLYAYNLAVVVDDAMQGITEVARGTDLLSQTPRQIYLQRSLELPTPEYLHFPVAVSSQGQKLSKQTGAGGVRSDRVGENLVAALEFLGLEPPSELASESGRVILDWGLSNFDPSPLAGVLSKPAPIMGGLGAD